MAKNIREVTKLNRTVLVGRLTNDVDLRYTSNGKAVGNFILAVNRPFKNAQGEQEADFIRCQAWGKQAENLANYMKKGSQIGIDGRIQTGSYQDKDGKTVYTTDVVADNVQFLESRNHSEKPDNQVENKKTQTFENEGTQIDIGDDDLPF